MITPGKILISSPQMEDPKFHRSVALITEHNENGTIALVVNKVFERTLNELAEFSTSRNFPLYNGGPVDQEHLFFIHRCRELIPGGALIVDNIYLGGDFKQVIAHINNGTITMGAIKIFIGYCGWDAGGLEEEIAEGSWKLMDGNSALAFADDPQLFLPDAFN